MADVFFSAARARPRSLASWARRHAEIETSRVEIPELLDGFDLDIAEVDDMPRASRLNLHGGRLRIEVRPGFTFMQRFNVAHELGHYLLATNLKVSFARQSKDRRFETYCNDFASHLLLPRKELAKQLVGTTPSLAFAVAVSRHFGVSLLSAVLALNDACGWDHVLVRWQSTAGDGWLALNVIAPRRCGLLESSAETQVYLSNLGPSPMEIDLPLRVDGATRRVHAEAMSDSKGGCFILFPVSAVV